MNLRRLMHARYSLFSPIWKIELRLRAVDFHSSLELLGRPIITKSPGSEIKIGKNVKIYSNARSNPLGLFLPTVIRTLNPRAQVILGDESGLSGVVVCAARSIIIGRNTLVGSGAVIIDNDFHELVDGFWNNVGINSAKGVSIGDNVFIGARAMILKGVTIGDGCVVGAGAVVTKSMPSGSIAVGNPARISSRSQG